jgi:hypothetical protein
MVGINVVDTYLLSTYHKLLNTQKSNDDDQDKKKVGVQSFAGILANQLIKYAKKIGNEERFLPEESEQSTALGIIETQDQDELSSPTFTQNTVLGGANKTTTTVITITPTDDEKTILRCLADANGCLRYLVRYEKTRNPCGKSRTKTRKCKRCLEKNIRRDVGNYCKTCGLGVSLCNKCDDRDCFDEHVKSIKRTTRQNRDGQLNNVRRSPRKHTSSNN